MPVITLYRHGVTAGTPPSAKAGGGLRGEVTGWSESSTRSNRLFLYSVDETQLTGDGYALSLTVRDIPSSHADWHQLRKAFSKRLDRLGLIRMHWLTEWQRRGAPHLHAAVWFPFSDRSYLPAILRAWLDLARPFGALSRSQNVVPIHEAIGWFQYLSKHAVRGLRHYQRSAESIPVGWQKTGRMWGRWGSWPLKDRVRVSVSMPGYHRFRRLVRSWRIADARVALSAARRRVDLLQQYRPGLILEVDRRRLRDAAARVSSARGMLRCPDPRLSAVRGVSEWMPIDQQLDLLELLQQLGHTVDG